MVGEDMALDVLGSLDDVSSILDQITTDKNLKLVRILDNRISDIRETVHQQVKAQWNQSVEMDVRERSLVLANQATLSNIFDGLRNFESPQELGRQLWDDFDDAIYYRYINDGEDHVTQISIDECSIRLQLGLQGPSLERSLQDTEKVIRFFDSRLPIEILNPFSECMMSAVFTQLKTTWLENAIPNILDNMNDYQSALDQTAKFVEIIRSLNWPGAQNFSDWISSAAKNWLNKRREDCLDRGRKMLSQGIGKTFHAEHSEQRIVMVDQTDLPRNDAENEIDETADDWDNGWGSGDDQDEDKGESQIHTEKSGRSPNDDDDGDAWGWGDEDTTIDQASSRTTPSQAKANDSKTIDPPHSPMQKITLTEAYWSSSMPRALMEIISELYDNINDLSGSKYNASPVSPAAGGLANIATLLLAEYRAIAPFYYENDPIGFMYAYNDALWLSDGLKSYQEGWRDRSDASTRVKQSLARLEPEIKSLESFGRRAYSRELDTQRLILRDLLGGSQNFVHQDDFICSADAVMAHISQLSGQWQRILPNSVWCTALGSLINTVSSKIISDIFDLSDISVDEAEGAAGLIGRVTRLESLFSSRSSSPTALGKVTRSKDRDPDPDPAVTAAATAAAAEDSHAGARTAQHVPLWLKLQFLGEVLQSNLKDIKYLWFESELSLHFTKDEVVDLIRLSFVDNANSRAAVREIRDRPLPLC